MTKTSWHPDHKPYVIESGDDKIIIRDGYSQWLLGPGADFNLFKELKSDNDDADYNLISIIQDLNHPDQQPIEYSGEAAKLNRVARHLHLTRKHTFNGRARPFDFESMDDAERPVHLVTPVPIRISSMPDDYAPDTLPDYLVPEEVDAEQAVIVGLMDDCLNLVHERFSYETADGTLGSRFDYAWMQDGISPTKSHVPYGLEITGFDIEDARLSNPAASDQDLLRSLGVLDIGQSSYQPGPLQFRTSHGTFVADLASGYAVTDAKAKHMRMIGVKLPVLSSQDTSGATLIAAIINGSNYIFERAKHMSTAMGVALPVVLNFSYGFFGGPHNGRHIVERALALHAETYREAVAGLQGGADVPVEITLPAGNSHLSQTHAASVTTKSDNQLSELPLQLALQPEDRTSSFIEFWLPHGATETKFSITTPQGVAHKFDLANLQRPFGTVLAQTNNGHLNRDSIIARIKLDQPNGKPKSGHRWRLLLALAPTKILDQPRSAAPHGLWHLALKAKLPEGTKLESWIQRDVSVSGLGQRGRQAYFVDDIYTDTRFDPYGDPRLFDNEHTPIKHDGTLSGIATVETDDDNIGVTVVGSCFHNNGTATSYSSAGSDTIQSPQVLVPTDSSRVLTGLLASGTYTGTVNAFNGTSAAAPQLARILAEAISQLKPTERNQYNRDAIIQAVKDSEPVLRPDADHPEYLTNNRIRFERVQRERLAPPSALKENIQRGRYAS